MMSYNRGFTLIEMAVSFAIAGLLAVIGIYGFKDFNNSVMLDRVAGDASLFFRRAQIVGSSGYASGQFSVSDALSADAVGVFLDYDSLNGEWFNRLTLYRDVGGDELVYDSADELLDIFDFGKTVALSFVARITPSGSCYNEINYDLYINFVRPELHPRVYLSAGNQIYERVLIGIKDLKSEDMRYLFVERTGQISLNSSKDLDPC